MHTPHYGNDQLGQLQKFICICLHYLRGYSFPNLDELFRNGLISICGAKTHLSILGQASVMKLRGTVLSELTQRLLASQERTQPCL